MPGTLYLVATPIGNLDDMPPRVAATFGLADFVAAEDTRVTLRLLNHLGLKKPMVSYYEHALHHGEAILNRIEAGENCALCSDAGRLYGTIIGRNDIPPMPDNLDDHAQYA